MSNPEPRNLGDLRTAPPPESLEDRVVDALKARRLIQPETEGAARMNMQYAINAAVAVVAMAVGLLLGHGVDPATEQAAVEEAGQQYVLLLYGDESYQAPASGRMQERVDEYSHWARDVAATGRHVAGWKLTDDNLLLMPDGARSEAVPTAEQGVLEGYFVITARDLEEAASIAESCPHLRYGGTVSLRRIDE